MLYAEALRIARSVGNALNLPTLAERLKGWAGEGEHQIAKNGKANLTLDVYDAAMLSVLLERATEVVELYAENERSSDSMRDLMARAYVALTGDPDSVDGLPLEGVVELLSSAVEQETDTCFNGHEYGPMDRSCGARICVRCGDHKGLVRCYCGWSASGGDGRRELIEMGETL